MQQHPYLRAYMAGIAVPSLFALVAVTVFTIARYVFHVPLDVERVIIFPLTIVPNLWGFWNILYIAALAKRNVPIGLFGAGLPLLIGPVGFSLSRLITFSPDFLAYGALIVFPVGLVIYYLAWKYLVASLNRIIGLA